MKSYIHLTNFINSVPKIIYTFLTDEYIKNIIKMRLSNRKLQKKLNKYKIAGTRVPLNMLIK